MGKKKRKDKPSSSGEDSILEDRPTCSQNNKQFDKKAKLEVMAGSHMSVTTSTMTDFSMLDIMKRFDTLEASLRSEMRELVTGIRQDFEKTVESMTRRHDVLENRIFALEKNTDELKTSVCAEKRRKQGVARKT